MTKNGKVSLAKLFGAFFRVGAFTFGGGMAMIPLLTKECVEKTNWITEDEILNYFAIGQCTPGIIAVNTATFVGFKKRGIPGAVAATLGIITPGFLIILLLATVLKQFSDNVYVAKAFAGIRVSVVAIILSAICNMVKKIDKSILVYSFCIAAFLIQIFTNISPVIVVAFTIAFGVLLNLFNSKREGD